MNDRIPAEGKAGRVLITPENGTPFYATVTMADEPLQEGTPLHKATLLKDSTAALLGGGADMVPDEALVALKVLIDGVDALAGTKAKIAAGTYTGTGTMGKANPTTVNCGFKPKLFVIYGYMGGRSGYTTNPDLAILIPSVGSNTLQMKATSNTANVTISTTDTGISYYSTATDYTAGEQYNQSGQVYHWVAFG